MTSNPTLSLARDKKPGQSFQLLQTVGKALMVPVSVLPIAGLLLGIGAAKFSFLPSTLLELSGGVIDRKSVV